MCLAIPARVKSIFGIEAEADIGGVCRTISLWLTPEARVGDYVYLHAGFAISVVDEAEALETLQMLHDLADSHPAEEQFFTTGDLPVDRRSGTGRRQSTED